MVIPPYQKAVDKTCIMQALQLARSIRTAEQDYYLANGTYITKQEELFLGFSNGTGNTFIQQDWTFPLQQQSGGIPWAVYARNNSIGGLLIVEYPTNWIACYAFASKERGKQACRSVSGLAQPTQKQKPNYWVYPIKL